MWKWYWWKRKRMGWRCMIISELQSGENKEVLVRRYERGLKRF